MTTEQKFESIASLWAHRSSPRVVVLAASAGGFAAIATVISTLPADFPAAVAVLLHRSEHEPERLPALLGSRTALKVKSACDGDLLEAGMVYICPPGVHMTAEHCLRLHAGPRLDYVRPSADSMLASVARTYQERAIAVVLSGRGHDGASGCRLLSHAGGTVLAQDPRQCAFSEMPASAIARGTVDEILPIEQVAEALIRLVGADAAAPRPERVAATLTRVILADDHRIMLDGLRALLASENDIEVVATADDGHSAVQLATRLSPDIVVIDIGLPDMDGIEATWRIKTRRPKTGVIGLSARTDSEAAARIAKAGASGFLGESAAFAELAIAIRTVAAHHVYFKTPNPA
jgi:two-component system chemotaxis response regulator CheB